MDDQQLGALLRAIRLRRCLRQIDVAAAAGVSGGSVSLIERGHLQKLSLEALRRVAAPLDVRVELVGRWRGGNADRLLSRRHSLLAESFAAFLRSRAGWTVQPEASFNVYGERGVIDQLAWHAATGQLLVIELKTEFVDVNELLGTLDRKTRLARTVAAGLGWQPRSVSTWLIVSDTKTNRRHAAEHATLLGSRFRLDGRRLRGWLMDPAQPTTGLAFWTFSNGRSTGSNTDAGKARSGAESGSKRPRGAGGRAKRAESGRIRACPGLERLPG